MRGVPEHQDEIDAGITRVLSADWRLARIDSILRAILRAGAFELIAMKDVPAKVVISEYVDVANAFFDGDEPKLVNGVLDAVGREARPDELDARR